MKKTYVTTHSGFSKDTQTKIRVTVVSDAGKAPETMSIEIENPGINGAVRSTRVILTKAEALTFIKAVAGAFLADYTQVNGATELDEDFMHGLENA